MYILGRGDSVCGTQIVLDVGRLRASLGETLGFPYEKNDDNVVFNCILIWYNSRPMNRVSFRRAVLAGGAELKGVFSLAKGLLA